MKFKAIIPADFRWWPRCLSRAEIAKVNTEMQYFPDGLEDEQLRQAAYADCRARGVPEVYFDGEGYWSPCVMKEEPLP